MKDNFIFHMMWTKDMSILICNFFLFVHGFILRGKNANLSHSTHLIVVQKCFNFDLMQNIIFQFVGQVCAE